MSPPDAPIAYEGFFAIHFFTMSDPGHAGACPYAPARISLDDFRARLLR
jgi:hypothetical protein